MRTTVRHLLDRKGREVHAVAPDTTVLSALQTMADHDVGAVLVTESERLLGIFSERDYARKVVLRGRSSKDTTVGELMSEDVVCVEPTRNVEECMALMTERRVRHLPVLDHGRLVGIISIGDVVSRIIADHEFVIQELEGYISGRT